MFIVEEIMYLKICLQEIDFPIKLQSPLTTVMRASFLTVLSLERGTETRMTASTVKARMHAWTC